MVKVNSWLAAIEPAGVPALRVVFTLAVIGLAMAGVYIYRWRHAFFDRDADVDNDFRVARDMRIENVAVVWGALMILLFCLCVATWRA